MLTAFLKVEVGDLSLSGSTEDKLNRDPARSESLLSLDWVENKFLDYYYDNQCFGFSYIVSLNDCLQINDAPSLG